MRFFTVSILSALAALVSATTTLPDYSVGPSGNPILYPGLNEQVPVGVPYKIEWTPTTEGTVSIWLLRGPSTNVQPIATLATGIPNSGEFTWTPSTTLQDDTTHYGLIIIVDGTGQYQYSTQFGIKNDATAASSSTAIATSSAAPVSISISLPVSVPAPVSSASSAIVVAPTTQIEAVETTSTSSASAVETASTSSASAVEATTTSSASAVETSATSSASAVETTATAVPIVPSNTVISVSVPTLAPSYTPVTPTTFASSGLIPKASATPSPSVLATFSGAADSKTTGFGAVAVAAGLMAVFAF